MAVGKGNYQLCQYLGHEFRKGQALPRMAHQMIEQRLRRAAKSKATIAKMSGFTWKRPADCTTTPSFWG